VDKQSLDYFGTTIPIYSGGSSGHISTRCRGSCGQGNLTGKAVYVLKHVIQAQELHNDATQIARAFVGRGEGR